MSKNSDPTDWRIKLDEAITYCAHKEAVKLARQALQRVSRKDLPGEIEYFKAQVEILRDNFSGAIQHLDAAIKYNPQDAAAYNDRALCMVELGIIDDAFYYFDRGIAAEPDYATIYHNKGWLLNNIGRHTEAIKCFKKALSLEPRRSVTYENLADALFHLRDYKGALKAYKKVLRLLKPGYRREIKKQIEAKVKTIEVALRDGREKKDGRCS